MLKLIILTLFAFLSGQVLAQPKINSLCKPYAQKQQWIKGDTVYWKQNFIPQFKQIIQNSKPDAVKNLTFKTSFQTGTRDYSDAEITARNRLRLQKDCGIQDENRMQGCNHYQAYCALHVSTETLGKAMEDFSDCALHRNRVCGETFQSPKDIENNLAELDQAFADISKIKESMGKDPVMSEYMSDVYDAYQKIADMLEQAKKDKLLALAQLGKERKAGDLSDKEMDELRKKTLSEMGNQVDKDELVLRKSDDGFRKASDVLNKCDDYLEKKGYDDEHNIISQVNICSSPGPKVTGEALEDFTQIVDNLDKQQKFQSLRQLTIKSIDNGIDLTVEEFASTFKAIYGNKPTESQMCANLGSKFCNPRAKEALKNLNIDKVGMMNYTKEMDEYNASAAKMNALCSQVKAGEKPAKLESEIQRQLTSVMYQTRIGQLMAFKKFRDVIKPFDQKACFEKGIGFAHLSSKPLLEKALKGVLELQKDKAKQLADYEGQVGYHTSAVSASASSKDYDAYQALLMKFLENDPYTVRKAIRASGSPDHALLLCKATAEIYSDEKTQRVWNWVGTGVCIAGSLAATVFTGGAAAPLLIASIAAGTSMGVYNLDRAMTRQHNKEMAQAIVSADPYLNSLEMKSADDEVKAAYVEIAMNLLPGAMKGLKVAGKAVGPLMKSSKLVGPLLEGASAASAKLGAGGQALMKTLKAGGEVTQEMLQKAIGEKLATATGKSASMLADLLRGAAPSAAMEISMAFALHPDPLSEGSIQAMLKGVAMSIAFEKLGQGGRSLLMKYRNGNLKTAISSVHMNGEVPHVAKADLIVPVATKPEATGLVIASEKPSNSYFNSFEGKQKEAWNDFQKSVDYNNLPKAKQQELLDIMYTTHKNNNGIDKVEMGKMRDLVEVQNFLKANGVKPQVAREQVRNLASEEVQILGEGKYAGLSDKEVSSLRSEYKSDPSKAEHLKGDYESLLIKRKEAMSKGDMKLKKKIDEDLEMIKTLYPKTADLDAIALNVKNGVQPAPKAVEKPVVSADEQNTIKETLKYSQDEQFKPLSSGIKDEPSFGKKKTEIERVQNELKAKIDELKNIKSRASPGSDDDIRITSAIKNLEGQQNLMKGVADDMNYQLDSMRGTLNEVKNGKLTSGKIENYDHLSPAERSRLNSDVGDNLARLKRMKQKVADGNLGTNELPEMKGVDLDSEISRLQKTADRIETHDYFNGLQGKQGEAMTTFHSEMDSAGIPKVRQEEILQAMHDTHKANNQEAGVAMGKKRDLVEVQNLLVESGMPVAKAREQVRVLASDDLRILGIKDQFNKLKTYFKSDKPAPVAPKAPSALVVEVAPVAPVAQSVKPVVKEVKAQVEAPPRPTREERKLEYESQQIKIERKPTSYLTAEGQKNLTPKAIEYLDTKKFVAAVQENNRLKLTRPAQEVGELKIDLSDINQARKYAYEMPALQEMGFGPVDHTWEKFTVDMEKSSLFGKRAGWRKRLPNGDMATIRLDYDPKKGAHYNVEIMQKTPQGKENFDLAIMFKCQGKPCTGEQVLEISKRIDDAN